MHANVKEMVRQCEICKKFATAPEPLRLIIFITVNESFNTWVIDAVVKMLTSKHNTYKKRHIITTLKYNTQ